MHHTDTSEFSHVDPISPPCGCSAQNSSSCTGPQGHWVTRSVQRAFTRSQAQGDQEKRPSVARALCKQGHARACKVCQCMQGVTNLEQGSRKKQNKTYLDKRVIIPALETHGPADREGQRSAASITCTDTDKLEIDSLTGRRLPCT